MPNGITRKHIVGRLGRTQAEPVPAQNFEEDAKNICRIEDQGVFTHLGRRILKGQEKRTFRTEE